MEIEISKEQLKSLIKLVYLGNWMINGVRSCENRIKEYEKLEQYIFSLTEGFGLEDYVEFDKECNEFYPLFDEDADIEKYKEDYDDELFWMEAADRLGGRDFYQNYTQEEIKKMSDQERFIKLQEFVIAYEEEFENCGIERLKIKEK